LDIPDEFAYMDPKLIEILSMTVGAEIEARLGA
jgi:predicted protein tyrosine phosphatase